MEIDRFRIATLPVADTLAELTPSVPITFSEPDPPIVGLPDRLNEVLAAEPLPLPPTPVASWMSIEPLSDGEAATMLGAPVIVTPAPVTDTLPVALHVSWLMSSVPLSPTDVAWIVGAPLSVTLAVPIVRLPVAEKPACELMVIVPLTGTEVVPIDGEPVSPRLVVPTVMLPVTPIPESDVEEIDGVPPSHRVVVLTLTLPVAVRLVLTIVGLPMIVNDELPVRVGPPESVSPTAAPTLICIETLVAASVAEPIVSPA
ncbi:MAG TPA: hypothetical protein ENH78_07185, partial [Phycisphaerae bacterium]|nr:hypothetical protein [Phycisphaerae bacterium]